MAQINENSIPEHNISIEQSLCSRCGLCISDCPDGVLFMAESAAEYNGEFCVKCGHCVAICPQGAVTISGYDDPPEAINPENKADPDALLAMIKSRRSMRQFTEKDVPPELISKIIEAGRYTPTGGNRQDVSYVVLREKKDECEKIALEIIRSMQPTLALTIPYIKNLVIGDRFLFKGAPVVIVIKSVDALNGALAASMMELMAQSIGLGVLYSGFFTMAIRESDELRRMLSISAPEKPVTTLIIGHPAVKYIRTAQRESARVIYR